MQNPFPSENQAESMAKKDLLFPHLNKNFKIQRLSSKGQASLETQAGALFQTMGVTGKKQHGAWSQK